MAPSTARLARPPRPPANPAYADPHYRRARARLLADGPTCAHCRRRPATEADHQPPLSVHPHLLGGACTCELVPSCAPCARRQGRRLAVIAGAVRRRRLMGTVTPAPAPTRVLPSAPATTTDLVGFDADDAVWDVPWLDDLRDVPPNATWPRLMTRPHPAAVGSYGQNVADHAAAGGAAFRWWQRLAFTRLLEHDDAGRLVWPESLTSTARQVGKSHGLREYGKWRLAHDDTALADALELVILHIARKLAVAVEVQRAARRWARADPAGRFKVSERPGEQQIERVDGLDWRWMVRAKNNVVSLTADVVFCDEAWDVPAGELEDEVIPTTVARGGQVQLWSTAHRKATALVTSRRVGADLANDTRLLIVEWSTPAGYDDGDPEGWRLASPHWDQLREELIGARYAAAVAGEASDDPDEPDPLAAFRCQWLNQWPLRPRQKGRGEPVVDPDVWARLVGRIAGDPVAVVVAINDNYGNGGAVAVAAIDQAGIVEVDGRLCESREDAFAGAARFARQYPTARTVVGVTLRGHVPTDYPRRFNVRAVGAQEAQTALVLLRDLAAGGRLRHHNSGPLDDQLAGARVYPLGGGGLAFANNGARLDLLKAALWAVAGVAAPKPAPQIH